MCACSYGRYSHAVPISVHGCPRTRRASASMHTHASAHACAVQGGGDKVGVLFVCLGNICRSPTAEVRSTLSTAAHFKTQRPWCWCRLMPQPFSSGRCHPPMLDCYYLFPISCGITHASTNPAECTKTDNTQGCRPAATPHTTLCQAMLRAANQLQAPWCRSCRKGSYVTPTTPNTALRQAMFRAVVERNGVAEKFDIDSCGTGGGSSDWYLPGGFSYHEGDAADPRMTATASRRGVKLTSRRVCRDHEGGALLTRA